ncbi:unnamed protein product [Clonostachys solani]|uniref:Uncharacterized protein n=1 Tax=Clonostachys solani TaxID=160281 RepID=A0A9P0EPK7_9HYPO|nr:unnamed protein product [Clonostachys solani]
MEARFSHEQSDERMIKEPVKSDLPCTREHDTVKMIGDNAFDLCDPNRANNTRCPNPSLGATEYDELRQYLERITFFSWGQGRD